VSDLFLARQDDPETSHVQVKKMSKDDDMRAYLLVLFHHSGARGMTGMQVQPYIHPSKHQSFFRQITSLRRKGFLHKIPEVRGGGGVHVHDSYITEWIKNASESDCLAYKRISQWQGK
jgi:hypothetical protein